jgi:hypothetical protein
VMAAVITILQFWLSSTVIDINPKSSETAEKLEDPGQSRIPIWARWSDPSLSNLMSESLVPTASNFNGWFSAGVGSIRNQRAEIGPQPDYSQVTYLLSNDCPCNCLPGSGPPAWWKAVQQKSRNLGPIARSLDTINDGSVWTLFLISELSPSTTSCFLLPISPPKAPTVSVCKYFQTVLAVFISV